MPGHSKQKWAITIAVIVGGIAVGSYLVHLGNTASWPETDCIVDSSRVVRENVADSFRNITLYRGEYRLRYIVRGREYHIWANSGWSDSDHQFVQDKVDAIPDHCNFRIRYNPANPAQAVAGRR